MKRDAQLEEWCKILAGQQPKLDVVPKGWFTICDMAEKMGKSRSHTTHLVAAACKRGELEKRMYRIATGRGPLPVPHYQPAKK